MFKMYIYGLGYFDLVARDFCVTLSVAAFSLTLVPIRLIIPEPWSRSPSSLSPLARASGFGSEANRAPRLNGPLDRATEAEEEEADSVWAFFSSSPILFHWVPRQFLYDHRQWEGGGGRRGSKATQSRLQPEKQREDYTGM